MLLKEPKNINYAAIVVEVSNTIPLEGMDNVQAAIILGNQVIVSKNIKKGDIGVYFPLECQLSKEYLSNNNLYRKSEFNVDTTQKGYFEENGRIRCVKFRGHKSEGLFMPIESMHSFLPYPEFEGLEIGVSFDELNGTPICSKYVVNTNKTPGQPGSKKSKSTKKYESKLVENQFRFHQDTSMLYKNLHRINPDSLISITYKLHGTSGISSYVLCKRHISKRERFAAFLHNIYTNITTLGKQKFVLQETEYDYLYSSRKVIKNEELNPNAQHYYGEDIWGIAHNELKEFLSKGMTFYYEIVGYLPNGGSIQKDYDYGCEPSKHAIYIYRITQTNVDGKVFEFSAKQVQDFCKKNGLNAVPELYYGYAKDFVEHFEILTAKADFGDTTLNCTVKKDFDSSDFMKRAKQLYNEKDCYMCSNKVPEEGIVVRIEGLDCEAYKQKSNRFYELETKLLDKGETNLEEEN